MASGHPSPQSPHLRATYCSPASAPFAHEHALPPLPSASSPAPDRAPDAAKTKATSAYLSRLRAAVAETQARINDELTARMEEDKAREAAAAPVDTKKKTKGGKGGNKGEIVDEEAEEENYGEEVVEED
jgi:hypothetical protein